MSDDYAPKDPEEPEESGEPVEQDEVEAAGDPGPLEEKAGEQLGVEPWDRPLIFRDAADAAVNNTLTYWLVMMLSGAIATLGLALDSTAVVIGAMLVAPLLAPIVGLSLALAVGDARLAVQSFAVVAGSLIIVVATAAALTALLPFHTITLEISSRIRPTTLDLGVAISSGLVAALVTVGRGNRLSAAIPGVAVAVALIPPLAVAGFGMATGWQTEVVWGALLLLGANLAGIVLSGVLVFLLIGMHRREVLEAAREWHEGSSARGVARWVAGLPVVSRAGVFGSPFGRAALVLGFVAALAIPLSAALKEVVRETRVRGAVADAAELLEEDDGTSILWDQVDMGQSSSMARVRVATTDGVTAEAREAFERRATELAGEPVALRLEQLPVSPGGASALQAMLGGGGEGDVAPQPAWPEAVARAREVLERAAWSLPFPEGAEPIGVTLRVEGGDGPVPADSVEVAYLAPRPLEPQTEDVLARALRRAVGHPDLVVSFDRVGLAVLLLEPGDTAGLGEQIALLRRYPSLVAGVSSDAADSVAAERLLEALREAGADSVRALGRDEPGPVELRIGRPGG